MSGRRQTRLVVSDDHFNCGSVYVATLHNIYHIVNGFAPFVVSGLGSCVLDEICGDISHCSYPYRIGDPCTQDDGTQGVCCYIGE